MTNETAKKLEAMGFVSSDLRLTYKHFMTFCTVIKPREPNKTVTFAADEEGRVYICKGAKNLKTEGFSKDDTLGPQIMIPLIPMVIGESSRH